MNNLIAITVRYIGPTNFRGSRIKLAAPLRGWNLTIPFDYECRDSEDGALKFLASKGLNPVSRACIKDSSVLLFAFSDCETIADLFSK